MSGEEPLFPEDQQLHEIITDDEIDIHNICKNNELYNLKNDPSKTYLHIATELGDFKVIKQLIKTGSDVNIKDKSGETPIMIAIKRKPRNCLQVIDILSKAKVDLHVVDEHGKNASYLIEEDDYFSTDYRVRIQFNLIYSHVRYNSKMTAQLLIELGYSIWELVSLGNTAVIEQMIRQGSSIDIHGPFGTTLLSEVVKHMDINMIYLLTEYGADVDEMDNGGNLAIVYYNKYIPEKPQNPKIIKLWLDKSVLLKDLSQPDMIRQFRGAFEYGNKEVIQMLLEYRNDILSLRDSSGMTPLHYLSQNDQPDVTEVLQGQTIDVDVVDPVGRTPLFLATQSSRTHINTFKFFLNNGANVNKKSPFEFSPEVPLFCLCKNHSISKETYFKIVEMFLKYGLDVQYVGSNQTTIFDIIAKHKQYYMAEPLLVHLAKLDELRNPILECIRMKIDSIDSFKKCFDVCKVELSEMKNNIINNKLTLHTIVVSEMSTKKILESCRFSSNSLLKLKKLQKKFRIDNHYNAVVQERISSIVFKIELLHTAAPVMCKLLKCINSSSHVVITEILDYLSDLDLQNLIKI